MLVEDEALVESEYLVLALWLEMSRFILSPPRLAMALLDVLLDEPCSDE
jgi:hypothetical protein